MLSSCSRSTIPQSSAPRNTAPRSVFVSNIIPDTKVGLQLRWLLGSIDALPLADNPIKSHFDSIFLSQVGPGKLNAGLAVLSGSGEVAFDGVLSETPTSLAVVTTSGKVEWKITISIDGEGLIAGLLLA